MGKYIIAGNWKMNKLPSETYDYIKEVIEATKGSECEVVCCTPFVCLPQAVEAAKGSHVKIGAENLHFEDKGAFTGEVSAEMLKDLGVDYVIMGHSERREYNNETDETVNLKAKKALEKGLIPIVCCGESLEQREAGITMDWIAIQIKKAFAGISADDAKKVVVAYEPIWAIGTGKSASQDDAQKMCKVVRDVVAADFGQEVADKVRVQYGGSVKPENVASYMACPDVDGALVGGASLEAESFLALLDFVK